MLADQSCQADKYHEWTPRHQFPQARSERTIPNFVVTVHYQLMIMVRNKVGMNARNAAAAST